MGSFKYWILLIAAVLQKIGSNILMKSYIILGSFLLEIMQKVTKICRAEK